MVLDSEKLGPDTHFQGKLLRAALEEKGFRKWVGWGLATGDFCVSARTLQGEVKRHQRSSLFIPVKVIVSEARAWTPQNTLDVPFNLQDVLLPQELLLPFNRRGTWKLRGT